MLTLRPGGGGRRNFGDSRGLPGRRGMVRSEKSLGETLFA